MPKSKGKLKRRSKGGNDSSLSESPSPDKRKNMLVPEETFLDKLMKKADSLRDTFEYDLASQFYRRILECEPENLTAIENLTYVYLQQVDYEQAEKCLSQAIPLSPNTGYGKYFVMGQLNDGYEALDYFKKGIQVLESSEAGAASPSSILENGPEGKARDLSMAYCGMVDVYMTDLCDEEDAESQCKNYIDLAISSDETNPEAYMSLASYHLVKEEQEDARLAAEKSLSLWFPDYKRSREEKTENCPLDYDSRLNMSKILIEVSMFDEAAEILDGLVEEDDRVVHVWYLLGLLNFLRGEIYYENSRFYCRKALKVIKKLGLREDCEDQINHIHEMLAKMGPENEDVDKEIELPENDDDEYETVSEDEEEEEEEEVEEPQQVERKERETEMES